MIQVERAICLNLDRRPDRWQGFCEVVNEQPWPFPAVQRVAAIDGQILANTCPDWWSCGNQCRFAQWGCHLSHLRIFEQGERERWGNTLILEDDVFFCDFLVDKVSSFLSRIQEPWDIVYLGGNYLPRKLDPAVDPPEEIATGILRMHGCLTTHAYIVNGESFGKLTHLLRNHSELRMIRRHAIDRFLAYFGQQGRITAYGVYPWIAGQRGEQISDISGEDHGPRFWNPPQWPLSAN